MTMRQLLAGGSLLFAGTALQAGIAFTANLVMMRYLLPEQVGLFAIALASIGLVFSFATFRLDICVLRTPDAEFSPTVRRRYLTAGLYETAAATALAVLVLTVSGLLETLPLLLVGVAALNHFVGFQKGFFMRRLPYLRLALVETGAPTIGHIVGVALVVAGAGIESLYIREATTAACAFLGLAIAGGIEWSRPIRLSRTDWGDLWRDARMVWLDGVLEGIFQRLSVIAALAVAGTHGAGLVFQAQRLAIVPHQILQPLLRTAIAGFARARDRAHGQEICLRFFVAFLAVLVPGAVVLTLYADPIVPFLLGDHWAPAAPVLAAMGLMIPSYSLYELLRGYVLTIHRHDGLFIARMSQLAGFAIPFAATGLGLAASAELVGGALSLAYFAAMTSLILMLRAAWTRRLA